MAKGKQDYSYCLKHQERVTTSRCCVCMKPICEECTIDTEIGKVCGEECHLKRVTSNERIADLEARSQGDPHAWLWGYIKLFGMILAIVVGAYLIWPKLPQEFRKNVQVFFKKAQGIQVSH